MIVVDECHRSIYGLWRGVLEYFDAHLVGLTATPTRQTKGFFDNNMVAQYTYEQAVADGVNVDFDIVRVNTTIREDGGAKIKKGTTVRIRDRQTRAQRYEELDEDFEYTTAQLGPRRDEDCHRFRRLDGRCVGRTHRTAYRGTQGARGTSARHRLVTRRPAHRHRRRRPHRKGLVRHHP